DQIIRSNLNSEADMNLITRGVSNDRVMLINGITLMALGLSLFILDSWSNLFVRSIVGLFWGTFFLILNGPSFIRSLRSLRQANDKQRRIKRNASTSEPLSRYRSGAAVR